MNSDQNTTSSSIAATPAKAATGRTRKYEPTRAPQPYHMEPKLSPAKEAEKKRRQEERREKEEKRDKQMMNAYKLIAKRHPQKLQHSTKIEEHIYKLLNGDMNLSWQVSHSDVKHFRETKLEKINGVWRERLKDSDAVALPTNNAATNATTAPPPPETTNAK